MWEEGEKSLKQEEEAWLGQPCERVTRSWVGQIGMLGSKMVFWGPERSRQTNVLLHQLALTSLTTDFPA